MTSPLENDNQAREAREFIDELRGRQIMSAKTLKGRPGLQPQQRMAIRAISVSYVIAGTPPKIDPSQMIRLLERFEEMARRQKMVINADLRPHILNLLVTEMWANKHSLDMPPEKLIAATAYHGAIGGRLLQKFPQFKDTPNIYRHAIAYYPANPLDFLRKVQAMLDEISVDKEFAEFLETPGIFKQAVMRNPSDPRGFLRILQNTKAAMEQEEEFIDFRSTPGIFKQAIISNPSDPRGYIRKIKQTISEMMKDDEFSNFINTPGILLQAVTRNPSDPRSFLRKVKVDVASMAKEKEFVQFHDKPNVLQYAAVHNTSDPRAFLRRNPKAEWHALLVKNRKVQTETKGKGKH